MGETNFSMSTKEMMRTNPRTNIAMMYPERQPFGAASAREKGKRKSEKPAAKMKIPRTSID